MKEDLNITIKIADVAPIRMTIKREGEEIVREAERSVNRVWNTWRTEFDEKSSKEVLAMVAVQFARLYFELAHSVDQQQYILKNFEKELDTLLKITDANNSSTSAN